MKIKSFECPKSIRNYETSDAWSTSRLSHRPREPANYIVDCRILSNAIEMSSVLTIAFLKIWSIGYPLPFQMLPKYISSLSTSDLHCTRPLVGQSVLDNWKLIFSCLYFMKPCRKRRRKNWRKHYYCRKTWARLIRWNRQGYRNR